VKIGDKTTRHGVPDRALVRETSGDRCYAVRLGDKGLFVGGEATWCGLTDPSETWWSWGLAWELCEVEIVALDLRGDESAEELRRLAEVFDVRQALRVEPGSPGFSRVYLNDELLGGFSGGDGLTFWARRLHDAGWRPGDSPERAWELLAEDAR
jgi:hypothetical protein